MVKLKKEQYQKYLLIGTAVLTTLAISPGIGYDPINLPKMLVVVTGASFLLMPLISELSDIYRRDKIFPILVFMLFLGLTISLFTNAAPLSQQLWGTWGRSTGLLTYFAFLVLMLTSYVMATYLNMEVLRVSFERLSYLISAYTLAQAGNIDPINWSQKLMVATLGNINFMSSFLGLASCSMFVRIINEKIPVTAKIHFGFFTSLNLFLIWISESIQGIGVLASGVVVAVAFKIRSSMGLGKSIYWILSVVPPGLLVFLGTAGIGPLSVLRQETVVFRIDYWLAGIRMTIDNWINGVGIDSYGDYYEQYRDLDAVLRTGPQRVTNTAHNIFLDVASGSGAIVGFTFLLLFVLSFINLYRTLKDGHYSPTDVAFASIYVGFVVFSLISINQIGVGVWGFISMGCLNGVRIRKEDQTRSDYKLKTHGFSKKFNTSNIENRESLIIGNFVGSIVIGLSGTSLAIIPNLIDAKMLNAVQQLDFDEMRRISTSNWSAIYYRNKYQSLAIENSRRGEVYDFAVKEAERNPRNGISLRIVAYSDTAPREKRLQAIERLREMDPFNADFLDELQELKRSIP